MDPRLKSIYNQLNAVYNPQRDLVNKQRPLVDQEYNTALSSLEQAKTNAFTDIGNQANRSGMFFSGFRPDEQARYTGTKYLPALAGVKQSYAQKKLSLEDQLNKIKLSQDSSARSILQKQIEEENRAREAELRRQQQMQIAQMRISASNARYASTQKDKPQPRLFVQGRGDNGSTQFGFTDAKGKPISAARYAQLTGQDVRDVIKYMGSQGDTYAQQIYNQLRLDPNPGRNVTQYKTMYSPLFWGT